MSKRVGKWTWQLFEQFNAIAARAVRACAACGCFGAGRGALLDVAAMSDARPDLHEFARLRGDALPRGKPRIPEHNRAARRRRGEEGRAHRHRPDGALVACARADALLCREVPLLEQPIVAAAVCGGRVRAQRETR